ncbi:MAG: hypothetical protein SGPRY_007466, partial [Prymnesium sp.]
AKATRHLLTGEFKDDLNEAQAAEKNRAAEIEWVPHWKPSLTLSLVEDFTVYPENHIPTRLNSSLVLLPGGMYLPVLFINEFWLLTEHLVPLQPNTTELPLELSFGMTTLIRWMLTVQIRDSMEAREALHGEGSGEEIKRMLTNTSPALLALTGFVALLHTIFDILAFKNDISFWKKNKSMHGLSLSTMLINLFFHVVIFLYLCDNDTSYVILTSNGVGLAIEVWKLKKAVKAIRLAIPPGSFFPRVVITPADSYVLSDTKAHDDEAMRYLSLLMYPLVVGYSAYSLTMETHKSFYSWLLSSVVGCVYTFGFIMMTPQAYHLLISLNTFVDDLFAFVITMPTMHRLSCLRDDVVFLVYLYQRYQYGVDKKRANEFGQVEDEDASTEPETEDSKKEK